jgi:hypothetical protein
MEESRIVYDAFEDIIASNETCEFFWNETLFSFDEMLQSCNAT